MVDLAADAQPRIVIGDGAVLDRDAREGRPGGDAGAGRGAVSGRELPIGTAVARHFEREQRPVAFDPVRLDPARQQRQQLDPDAQDVDFRQVRRMPARHVRQRHAVRGQAQRREQREGEVALDAESAPRGPAHALLDLNAQRAGRHDERDSQDREHDQRGQSTQKAQQNATIHGAASIARPPRFRRPDRGGGKPCFCGGRAIFSRSPRGTVQL